MTTSGRLIWEDEDGQVDFDEERMLQWFAMAIANIEAFDIDESEAAWMLFLMGAETTLRGNRGDSPYETEDS